MKNVLFIDSIMHSKEEGLRAAMISLVSNLRKNDIEVKTDVFRLENQDLSLDEFREKEKNFIEGITKEAKNYDAVCVSGWTGSWDRMKKIAQVIKKESPETKIIFGGPHVDLSYFLRKKLNDRPLDVIFEECPEVDCCVFGEGEETLLEILSDLPKEKIKGLVYRDNSEIKYNSERKLEKNLDNLPFPDIKEDETSKAKWVYIEASRGCKHRCEFCIEPQKWGYEYRVKSPSRIVQEIEYWQKKGIRHFRFTDSSLTSYPQLKELFNEIDSKKLDVRWSCFARISEINKNQELVKEMKSAGCETLLIGFESGEQKILNGMKKGFGLAEAESVVNLLKENGIKIRGSWILGYPGESREMLKETIAFAKKLDLDAYAPHIYENQESVFSKYQFSKFGTKLDMPTKAFTELFSKEKEETESSKEMHELDRVAGQVIDENLLSKEIDPETHLSELEKFIRMQEFLKEITNEMKNEIYDEKDKFDRMEFLKLR